MPTSDRSYKEKATQRGTLDRTNLGHNLVPNSNQHWIYAIGKRFER
jgi:hypothetical protein